MRTRLEEIAAEVCEQIEDSDDWYALVLAALERAHAAGVAAERARVVAEIEAMGKEYTAEADRFHGTVLSSAYKQALVVVAVLGVLLDKVRQ